MLRNADRPNPGWYPDPKYGQGLRFWDGIRWTESTHRPKPEPEPEADPGLDLAWRIGAVVTVLLAVWIFWP